MSDELKAAAQRVAESIELAASGVSEGDALERTYNGDIDGFTRDMKRLADSTLASLDAKEAERAERAKPIDAEWCLANGAEQVGDCSMYRWQFGSTRVEWDAGNGTTIDEFDGAWVWMPSITTRGQLLDLLAALKGGA